MDEIGASAARPARSLTESAGRPPPSLAPRLEAWAPGLIWLLGLFHRWDRLDPHSLAGWRFHDLVGEEGVVASACGDGAATGWWAILGQRPEDAVDLTLRAGLGQRARRLSMGDAVFERLLTEDRVFAARAGGLLRATALRGPLGPASHPGGPVGRATPADLDALLTFPVTVAAQREAEARVVLRARITRGEVYVAREGRRVVAMAEGLRCGPYLDIQRLYTAPSARRRGHGRRLIQLILTHACASGLRASLCVETDNQPARRLYSELGFTEVWSRVDVDLSSRA